MTFDGIHIINGEIVSPRPEILIALKDENPFLMMDEPSDTSLFKVFFFSGWTAFSDILIRESKDTIAFIPATDTKNRAKYCIRPFLKTMERIAYWCRRPINREINREILIIELKFEVVNKSSISEVLNYPNPFSTSTQFVFTLTGSQIPDRI